VTVDPIDERVVLASSPIHLYRSETGVRVESLLASKLYLPR